MPPLKNTHRHTHPALTDTHRHPHCTVHTQTRAQRKRPHAQYTHTHTHTHTHTTRSKMKRCGAERTLRKRQQVRVRRGRRFVSSRWKGATQRGGVPPEGGGCMGVCCVVVGGGVVSIGGVAVGEGVVVGRSGETGGGVMVGGDVVVEATNAKPSAAAHRRPLLPIAIVAAAASRLEASRFSVRFPSGADGGGREGSSADGRLPSQWRDVARALGGHRRLPLSSSRAASSHPPPSACSGRLPPTPLFPSFLQPVIKAGKHALIDVCSAPNNFERLVGAIVDKPPSPNCPTERPTQQPRRNPSTRPPPWRWPRSGDVFAQLPSALCRRLVVSSRAAAACRRGGGRAGGEGGENADGKGGGGSLGRLVAGGRQSCR